MSISSASNVTGQSGQQATSGTDAFQEVDLDVFIKLLIAELQNQDPMNPLDNHEILQQVSQIREIESNDDDVVLPGVLLAEFGRR